MNRDPVQVSAALGLAILVGLGIPGCGGVEKPARTPSVRFFAGHTAPYGRKTSRRVDLLAEVSNPTPHGLSGVYLEVQLIDGPGVSMEFGRVPPRGEGSAWTPVKLSKPVDAAAFLGGPAEVVSPEGEGSLPELWLLTRIESAVFGYTLDGKKETVRVTDVINQGLAGWNEAEGKAAKTWRARSARRRLELFRSIESGDVTTGEVADL